MNTISPLKKKRNKKNSYISSKDMLCDVHGKGFSLASRRAAALFGLSTPLRRPDVLIGT
jgi:hypothetical protein